MVECLMAHGADVGLSNSVGQLAIGHASTEQKQKSYLKKILEVIQQGNPKVLEALFVYKQESVREINSEDNLGWQPVHHAVRLGNVEMVNVLLKFGADVNAAINDESGRRPLHLAAYDGNEEMVECLTARGADANLSNNLGQLPVHHASSKSMMALIEKLTLDNDEEELDLDVLEKNDEDEWDLEILKLEQALKKEEDKLRKISLQEQALEEFNAQDAEKPQGTIFDAVKRGNVADVK